MQRSARRRLSGPGSIITRTCSPVLFFSLPPVSSGRVTVRFSFPVLLSCTTSLVYVNLSMRKPPQGRKPQRNSLEERPSLFAVAKVHRLSTLHKNSHNFFDGLLALFSALIIYIIWQQGGFLGTLMGGLRGLQGSAARLATHRAAIRDGARCITDCMPLHPPSHRSTTNNAAHCGEGRTRT